MLKVYKMRYYVSIDNEKWFEVDDGYYPYILRDDKEPTVCNIINNMTFEECYELLQNNGLCGLKYDKTIFNKKRIIVMRSWSYDQWYAYKDFKTISYKCVFVEFPKMTLSEIFKHFPADQCIQYLKERGITACPMNF